jgi:micrococcal nuclease
VANVPHRRYGPSMVRTRAVVVAILAAASLGGWWLGHVDRGAASESAVVVDALDGDTVEVRIGTRTDTVRLLGIDTPETHHPTKPVQCFGPEAAAYTKARLLGRTVRLEDDVEPRDLYGRRLAYVYVDGRRFNDELIERGYARLLVIPPNGSHARTMLAAELDAKRAGVGLWGAC